MKRSMAALVLALATVFAAGSCNETNTTFQRNTGALLSFLSPADANAGGGDFTLTASGAGFVEKTVIQWNGKSRTTTFVNSSQLTATISASDIASPGRVFVNTLSPARYSNDNGLSTPLAFIIGPALNPVPAITSISPTSATACGVSCAGVTVTLMINGSSFLPKTDPSGGSVVHWNSGLIQSDLSTTAISAAQITATVPGNLISAAGTATVTVFNPVPGGGTSPNGQPFTINPGPIAAHDVAEDSPAMSADGRYVAYTGVEGDHSQIFLRDTCEGADSDCQPRTSLVSAAEDGAAGDGDSRSPSVSADGRYIAFSSAATNLRKEAAPGRQVFLRETCLGGAASCKPATQLISTDANGALSGTENLLPSVSASGRFVAFLSVTPSRATPKAGAKGAASTSTAPNSGYRQVFVRDTCIGGANDCTPRTTRISIQPGDAPAAGARTKPALSGSARRLALAGRDATLFTRGTAVDDSVFLALIDSKQ